MTHATSSSGVTEANCTTRSRPAAEITWNIGRNNQSLNTSLVSLYSKSDGITTVTSTLLLSSGQLIERSIQCIVHYKGLENPLYVSLNTPGELSTDLGLNSLTSCMTASNYSIQFSEGVYFKPMSINYLQLKLRK